MSPGFRELALVLLGSAAVAALPGCGTDTTSFSTSTGSGGGGEQSSGTTSSATSTGSAEMCPGVGDPCTGCESVSCPKAYCDCYKDSECVLMAACLAKCAIDDVPCDQLCWTAHPSAISKGALMLDCAATTCAKGCPGYKPLGACLVCVYTSCQMEMNTCIARPDCTQLLACVAACTVPGCETSCYQQFPDGAAGAGPVANCLQAKCPTECAP